MAFARFSTGFRHDRAGMAGLAILAVFVATAILAPILIPESAIDVTKATGAQHMVRKVSRRYCVHSCFLTSAA